LKIKFEKIEKLSEIFWNYFLGKNRRSLESNKKSKNLYLGLLYRTIWIGCRLGSDKTKRMDK